MPRKQVEGRRRKRSATRVLVTGGAGFLGSAIVKQLVEQGAAVRVLALPGEPLDNLNGTDVELMRGNVLSPDDARQAVSGCETVYHAAAVFKGYMKDPMPMYDVAQRGTFNVLEAARQAGVNTAVYTASIVGLGRPPLGAMGNEDTPYEAWDVNFHYSRSKHIGLLTAKSFADWGMDVRIVCPGAIFGPGDIAPTPSGRLLINMVKGRENPLYVDGGVGYVDVRDAARVHLLAAERGKPGEVYIASAHNLDNKALGEAMARVLGVKAKARRLPTRLGQALVALLAMKRIRDGKEPHITLPMLNYALKPGFYDNGKSIRELGARYRPIEETIRDAVEYFRGRGMV
jgi:dihydroflavonol-4-reductase